MGTVRNILKAKGKAIFSISSTATVFQALERMVENDIGALLVMAEGNFVGIFTEKDYARKVILKGKASKDTLIQEIMTEHPVTVTPDHTIDECLSIMSNRYFRHLPVVEKGQVVGLISILDVVRYVMDEQKSTIHNLEQYISGY
jgi:CBS domain-containing protein